MKITAYFTNDGTPATGLSPTIDGWEIAGAQVITAQAMTEQAGGWYYYEYAGYDETKDYVFRCDGTATLSGYDRYTFGSNRDDLEMATKLPTNYLMGSSVATDKDDEIDAILEDTGTTIPGTITTMQADLDNPNQYKADVSALATEANATTNTTNLTTEIDANETKIDTIIAKTDNLPDDPADQSILAGLIKQLREGNIKYEYTIATVQNATRKVDIDRLDYFTIKVKNDGDANWDTPVDTKILYLWYANLGDENPIYVGESD